MHFSPPNIGVFEYFVQGGLNIFIAPNDVCVGGWVCGIRISEIIIEY